MEKIRTYRSEDFVRANKVFERAKEVQPLRRAYFSKEDLATGNHTKVEAVALGDAMYAQHRPWVEKTFSPVLPYLFRDATPQTKDSVMQAVTKHYSEGLAETADTVSRVLSRSDLQDIVVGYTQRFKEVLMACETLGINPDAALKFARQAYNTNGKELQELFAEYQPYGGFSPLVVDRAASDDAPDQVLRNYGRVKEKSYKLSQMPQYAERSQRDLDLLALPASFKPWRDKTEGTPIEYSPDDARDIIRVDDVPIWQQRHRNWCGYTTASMSLKRWGINYAPEEFFRRIHGEYDEVLEHLAPVAGPTIYNLGATAKEVISEKRAIDPDIPEMKVQVMENEHFQRLAGKGWTREDIVENFIKKDIPVIIRRPGHFVLTVGINKRDERYIVNDPLSGRQLESDIFQFNRLWEQKDSNYPDPSRSSNLLLAIYPTK